MPKNAIILVGIKHSGKSTEGRRLAEQYGVPLFDIDEVIEQLTGKTVRQLYIENGKNAFMQAEVSACQFVADAYRALETEPTSKTDCTLVTDCAHKAESTLEAEQTKETVSVIIATGGGICDNIPALDVLRQFGRFRYIEINEEDAFARIAKKSTELGWPAFICGGKPASIDEARAEFHKFYVRRTEQYRAMADETVRLDIYMQKNV